MKYVAYCLKDEYVDYSVPIFMQEAKQTDKVALRYFAAFLRSGELGTDPLFFKDKYIYRIGLYDSDTAYLASEQPECIYSLEELFTEVCKDSKWFNARFNSEESEENDDEVCETV